MNRNTLFTTSHSPQASAWGWSDAERGKPFQRFRELRRQMFLGLMETVETVPILELAYDPRLKPGENETSTLPAPDSSYSILPADLFSVDADGESFSRLIHRQLNEFALTVFLFVCDIGPRCVVVWRRQ